MRRACAEPPSITSGAPALPITTNVIAGSHANTAGAGVRGATIAGGGAPANSDPDETGEAPNSVTGSYGTIGGGYGNAAGQLATIGGGLGNSAGERATIGGGYLNTATNYSTIGGRGQQCHHGDRWHRGGGHVESGGLWRSGGSGPKQHCRSIEVSSEAGREQYFPQ